MRSRVIGMPINDEIKRRILDDVERRARGYFAPVPEAPIDFEEPAQPTTRSMSYTKPDPCEKIRAAERSGKISAAFSRSAQALVKQGKLSESQVDEFVSSMSKRPVGVVRGWSEDDE